MSNTEDGLVEFDGTTHEDDSGVAMPLLAEDLDDDDFGGFDVAEELLEASVEDRGTVVKITKLNGKQARVLVNGEVVYTTITVTGVNSRRYRAEEKAIRDRKVDKITHQKFYDDSIEKAAACTLEWTGILNKGQPVRCDRANAAQIYKLFPRLLEQVTEAMNEHALFTKNSSPAQ